MGIMSVLLGGILALCHLAVVIHCSTVPMLITQIKAIGKSGTEYNLKSKCEFEVMEPVIPARNATFTIQFDRPTTKFSSRQVVVLSRVTDGTSYTVTNKAQIEKSTFVITMSSVVNTSPESSPVGTCTLEAVDTSTSTSTSTTTTTTPTTTAPTSTSTSTSTTSTTTSTTTASTSTSTSTSTTTTTTPTTTSTSTSTTTTTTTTTTTDSPYGDVQYIENGDMELDFTNNWYCHTDCILDYSNDSYTGARSARVTGRNAVWKGLSQIVNLTAGVRYSMSGFVKLLNTENDALYHSIDIVLQSSNNQGDKLFHKFGTNIVEPGVWTEFQAILVPQIGYTSFRIYVQVGGLADYVADTFSIRELLDIVDWRPKAEARIDRLRKADFSVSISSTNVLPENLTMEVYQNRHTFGFGSAVGASQIVNDTDPTLLKYQDFFYDHFEWAVLENALKWKIMEKTPGDIDYDRPLNAINALRSRGIPVRGHSVFWGVEKNVPSWIVTYNRTEILNAMETRINGVVGATNGLLAHWDVNNENLHGDFYEMKTEDPNITMKMFKDVHAVDPGAELFLSDYGIIEQRSRNLATAIKQQALKFLSAGVPIHGIGFQSHIKDANLDITAMKERLDTLAEAGLPIWVTEFSVEETDEIKKAQAVDDALTLYFSHPAVEGVLLWGFWDGKIFAESAALVEGPDLTPNAAGLAYQTLFKYTWRTQATHAIVDTNPIYIRGFKGDYTVTIKQDDTVIKTQNFTLENSNTAIEIDLD